MNSTQFSNTLCRKYKGFRTWWVKSRIIFHFVFLFVKKDSQSKKCLRAYIKSRALPVNYDPKDMAASSFRTNTSKRLNASLKRILRALPLITTILSQR